MARKGEAGTRVLPADLAPEDQAFLQTWLAQAGDHATLAALRGRVRVILALQREHPGHPPLAVLVTDPGVRAVLLAKPRARAGVRRTLRRRLARG